MIGQWLFTMKNVVYNNTNNEYINVLIISLDV